jgi:hypothetical protein
MTIEELETTVMKECSFLSYCLEEYEKELKTNPVDQSLKEMVMALKKKHKKFDRIYRYIIEIKKER